MKRLAIFVSGSGTNMDSIVKKVKSKKIRGVRIAVVISDKEKAPALSKARRHGVEALFIDPKTYRSKSAYEKAIHAELKKRGVDYIILAGFMRIISPYLLKAYKNRIVNIHPALLPSFKGAHGIKDAYDAGVKVTGVTVHFVTDDLDAGPIIVQEALAVGKNETLTSLERRIHRLEYKLYAEAIQLLVKGKLRIRGRKVDIL